MPAPRTKIERRYFRSGRLREETSLSGRERHGLHRTWHRNGRRASEQIYEHDRLHGLCRQWNERGKLLGSFSMTHGTGIHFDWFDNGQTRSEFSSVEGKFTGRIRAWLRDGTLVSEQFTIENRNVTSAAYATAAAKQKDWPRYRISHAKQKFPAPDEIDRREFQLQITWLRAQKNKREVRTWLKAGALKRSLGLLKFFQAQQLVEKLFAAGVRQIFAVNIYSDKHGKQFSDVLLVKLPPEKSTRQTIRRLLVNLPARQRAGVMPSNDIGEPFIYASFE